MQINRRIFIAGFACCVAGCTTHSQEEPALQTAHYAAEVYPVRVVDRRKFDRRFRPVRIATPTTDAPGTILVDTSLKQLTVVESPGVLWRYGVAVGRTGLSWKGAAIVGRKAKWPAWYPTDDMHRETPGLPMRIHPGPANPLGARALYLFTNGKDTLYRIHGTNEPWTIGTEASSGCIRMLNEDVIDLWDKVPVGAKVTVL